MRMTPRHRPAPLGGAATFFILGMGRSGTNFLAQLLDLCDGAAVFHEPVPADFTAFVAAHGSAPAARRYMRSRLAAMEQLIAGREVRVYGEVNSALRFHAPAIAEILPDAMLLHLARDGREVVRSVMERNHYRPGAVGHHDLRPAADDALAARWDALSRFEKVAWLWADANARLRASALPVVRFEDVRADYDAFCSQVLHPCGLQLDRETWAVETARPTNTTTQFAFAHWRDWTHEQRAAFDAICGAEMAALGYS